ncbi:MAG TPA: spermidine/putrescine ABC transporter substrate-binding protein [Tepidisphaeraceae bacterium]|nr:spermidine/putrescine ABC transporter substrate-binding protein [Tepidisphaeraceae bacterium]
MALFAPAGCSRTPATSAAGGEGGAGALKELNIFVFSDYVPQRVLDGFTKETGIRVNATFYDTNEELLAKLLAGGTRYDLIQPSDYTVEALRKNNLLQPIDFSKVPNLANIGPQYLHLPFDPDQKYSVPYMTGTVGIIVNTAKIKDPILGYRDVFQPKYKGRIVVVDDGREMVSWALACLGHSVNDINAQTLAQVRPLLASWIPLIKLFAGNSPKDALLGGDCDLGVIYCGDAAKVIDADPRFHYILPVEGAHRFIDTLAIPTTSTHPEAAAMFMNYILRPDVSVLISKEWPYTNPNLAARKLLTSAELSNPASYPSDTGKLEIFRDIGNESTEVDKLVTDLKNGG